MTTRNDIIREYLRRKQFNRITPINGYECYEKDLMKASIDFDTCEYIFTHPHKETQHGKYENALMFIIQIDKYRLL